MLTAPEFQSSEPSLLEETPEETFTVAETMAKRAYLAEEQSLSEETAPERNLIAALIERTILDLKQPDHMTRKYAEKWLFERDVFPAPIFSLPWCLEATDMLDGLVTLRCKCRALIEDKSAQLAKIGEESLDAVAVVREWRGNGKGIGAVKALFLV